MTRLLLIENDIDYIYIIKNELEHIVGKYQVLVATNRQEGISTLKAEKVDVVLCNAEIAGENAYKAPTVIRQEDQDVVIILSGARLSSKDVISAYQNGMNAYLLKPFMPLELCACIDSLLRLKKQNNNIIPFVGDKNEFSLDTRHCILLNNKKEKNIYLTKREALILELLNKSKGNIVRREEIIVNIWEKKDGEDLYASRSLDVVIARLRSKLKECCNIQIVTAKGVGLRLEY